MASKMDGVKSATDTNEHLPFLVYDFVDRRSAGFEAGVWIPVDLAEMWILVVVAAK